MKCIEAYPTLHKVPNCSKKLHYSDHLAVYASFEIDEKLAEKKSISIEDNEIIDEETRRHLRAACAVVEESIQNIRRDQIILVFGTFILVFILFSFNDNQLSISYLPKIFIILKNFLCYIGLAVSIWFITLGKPVERNSLSAVRNAMHLRLHASQFIY